MGETVVAEVDSDAGRSHRDLIDQQSDDPRLLRRKQPIPHSVEAAQSIDDRGLVPTAPSPCVVDRSLWALPPSAPGGLPALWRKNMDLITNTLVSWKTTILGVAVIAGVLAK